MRTWPVGGGIRQPGAGAAFAPAASRELANSLDVPAHRAHRGAAVFRLGYRHVVGSFAALVWLASTAAAQTVFDTQGIPAPSGRRQLAAGAVGDSSSHRQGDDAATSGHARDGLGIDIEGGITHDDNVTRGRLSSERRNDNIFSLAASKSAIFPTGENTRVVLLGSAGGDKFHSYDGLDRLFASLRSEFQYRPSADFSAPILSVYAVATGERYRSQLRRGWRVSAGASIVQPVTDRIRIFGALAHNERNARNDVFTGRDNSVQLNLDYALSPGSALYLAGEYRRGDTVVTGVQSLANIDIAKLLVADDAFKHPQLYAYRIDAKTRLFTLGYNHAFSERSSLDLSWRRARADPDERPSYNASGSWDYTVDQYSLYYLMRF